MVREVLPKQGEAASPEMLGRVRCDGAMANVRCGKDVASYCAATQHDVVDGLRGLPNPEWKM